MYRLTGFMAVMHRKINFLFKVIKTSKTFLICQNTPAVRYINEIIQSATAL